MCDFWFSVPASFFPVILGRSVGDNSWMFMFPSGGGGSAVSARRAKMKSLVQSGSSCVMNSTGVTRRAISHRGTVTTGCQHDRPWCHCDAKIDMTWIPGRTSRTGVRKAALSVSLGVMNDRMWNAFVSFWSGATSGVCLSDRWHHAKSFLRIWRCVCTLALSWCLWMKAAPTQQNKAACSHFSLFHSSSSGFPSFPRTIPFLCTRPLFSRVCKHSQPSIHERNGSCESEDFALWLRYVPLALGQKMWARPPGWKPHLVLRGASSRYDPHHVFSALPRPKG